MDEPECVSTRTMLLDALKIIGLKFDRPGPDGHRLAWLLVVRPNSHEFGYFKTVITQRVVDCQVE